MIFVFLNKFVSIPRSWWNGAQLSRSDVSCQGLGQTFVFIFFKYIFKYIFFSIYLNYLFLLNNNIAEHPSYIVLLGGLERAQK